jgi:hypothetical protein
MQAAIGYLRVSTREQGRSGLGLAAQRHEIEAWAAPSMEGFSIRSHQDIQTGARADALMLRPVPSRVPFAAIHPRELMPTASSSFTDPSRIRELIIDFPAAIWWEPWRR